MSSTSKTPNLNLNQWAAADGVCRADFNADNLAIDTAIGAVPLVKLKEITTSASAASVEVSLSDIDMSKYSEIWMDVQLGVSWVTNNTACFRVNNISSANYSDCCISSYAPFMNSSISYARLYIGLHRFVLGSTLCWLKPNLAFYGEIAAAALSPHNWTSITFYLTNGTIPAGGKVKIYGVKKI
jgi:hypothetical protein